MKFGRNLPLATFGIERVNGTRIPRAVFWIPKPRIPDSTSKNFPGFRIPQAKISGIPDFLTLGDTKTVFHNLVPRVLSYPSLREPGNEIHWDYILY